MLGNGLHLPIREAEIPAILEPLRATNLPDDEGIYRVDWAGIRTRIPMLPWAPQELTGTTSTALPIPTDGYRSEAEEYVALAVSLTSDRDSYRVVEVGAGWAPWAVMGVVCAERSGKRARGIAVEAEPRRAEWARQHSADNGVDSLITVVEAACWNTDTTLSFPVLDEIDMGGAVLSSAASPDGAPSMDYRGAFITHRGVRTVTLHSLLAGDEPTDLLHVDLQGIELEVILPALDLIEQKVRFLAVGTHNRYVEGMLQNTLLRREWALLLESPSTAIFDGVRPSLTGFTIQDGNQLWANSRFRDAHPMLIRQR
jgi:FkbM family methyltransferase